MDLIPKKNIIGFNFEDPLKKPFRRFHVNWDPEYIQDLEALHGIDIESELTNLINQQFAGLISNEIIPIQPIGVPAHHVYPFNAIDNHTVLEDGSWYMGNHFESVLGPTISLKQHEF